MDNLEFSLKLKEQGVKITTPNGNVKNYVLKELTGEQRDSFLNMMASRLVMKDGKVQSLSSFDGLQASLVAECLYDEKGESIDKDIIQKYPAQVLASLFKAAQELSGMDISEEEQEEVKND